MGKFTFANLKKTLYYLQRNGIRNTWNAARERLSAVEEYSFKPLSEEEKKALREQARESIRNWSAAEEEVPTFSILVPAYRTNPAFLKDLVISLREQVYPFWELILLDASGDESVHASLEEICAETRVTIFSENVADDEDDAVNVGSLCYVRLAENGGISVNTNAGISHAHGRYVGLLDHDDVLTPDALYEMAKAIRGRKEAGEAAAETRQSLAEEIRRSEVTETRQSLAKEARQSGTEEARLFWTENAPLVLYSDEDKWDGEQYYEPNLKEDFNLDLLLSNNYVCHFLVMERELFRKLRLRKEFDGAQDYDLVLRAAAEIMERGLVPETAIRHVPKVLYHWRCHGGSTAENPQSKLYAYEAGKRALQEFANEQGWNADAVDLKHVGFYRLNYGVDVKSDGIRRQEENPVLSNRFDLGAVGGKVLDERGQALAGGRMAEDGSVFYEGLKEGFSGPLNRAVLTQDAEAVDLRCICVAKEFWPLFESVVGVPYRTRKTMECKELGDTDASAPQIAIFDAGTLPENADVKALSLAFCKELRERGKRILWDPKLAVRTGDKKNHQVP